MEYRLNIRNSDSPFVEAVTSWIIGNEDRGMAVPDGCWDLVVLKQDGQTNIMLTGQTTKAVPLHFIPGDELLTISFNASVFLSSIPSAAMLDNAILLDKTSNSFQLATDIFEIPTFDNVESFVENMIKKEHLFQDEVVKELLLDHPQPYSSRSLQRRFLRATGMTQAYFHQIRRARQAATLLQNGIPAIEVAYETNFSDQPHMSRSLKHILGYTPTEIATLKSL
jgi:AraC-like DNA-binding protein